jgi:hypothetical protein
MPGTSLASRLPASQRRLCAEMYLRDVGVGGRIILKLMFSDMVWTGFSRLSIVTASCEDGN